MGKISRFGLMELSRQRLRPALSEGSHITCPRCNGVGVIRDTDSSALHILRILQEEAMKENTAAIHAQVPVDVATFLLNEKRTDIAKLEARHRISIVLIPNKFLETPHYKIERLKHDDERLDQAKASYDRAEAPSLDTVYGIAKPGEGERARPKQEAVVRGIVPETPAPVVAPPAPVAPAPAAPPAATPALSLWDRFWALVTGKPVAAPVAKAQRPVEQPVRAEAAAPERGRERGERGRDRGGRRRDEQRGPRAEGQKREQQRDKRGARPEERERKPAEARPETEGRDRRPPRPERGPRPRQEAAASGAEVAAPTAAAAPVTLPVAAPVVEAPAQIPAIEAPALAEAAGEAAGEERKGRRRRRRRGRGERETERADSTSDQLQLEEAVTEQTAVADEAEPQAPFAPVAVEAPVAPTPAPAIAAPTPAPAAVAPTTLALPHAEPVPMAFEALTPLLDQAGLTLVQTSPEKHAEALARIASEPKPIRIPRERPVLAAPDIGPLIQVETQRRETRSPPAAG
jgi:ribonuclease E